MLAFSYSPVLFAGWVRMEIEVEASHPPTSFQVDAAHLQLAKKFRKKEGLEHHIFQPRCGSRFVILQRNLVVGAND